MSYDDPVSLAKIHGEELEEARMEASFGGQCNLLVMILAELQHLSFLVNRLVPDEEGSNE